MKGRFEKALRQLPGIVAFFVLAVASLPAKGQAIGIYNDYSDFVWLWLYVGNRYDNPPTPIPIESAAGVDLTRPGAYYLVIRDGDGVDRAIGWRDLHLVYQRFPTATIGIRRLFVTEVRTRTYTVWTGTAWETVTRQYAVQVPSRNPILYVYTCQGAFRLDDFLRQSGQAPR